MFGLPWNWVFFTFLWYCKVFPMWDPLGLPWN